MVSLIKREVKNNPRLTASEATGERDRSNNPALAAEGCGVAMPYRSQETAHQRPHEEEHLAFAKKYAHWTSAQCRKVMFSDESTFQMGSAKVRCPSSFSRYNPAYKIPNVKHPRREAGGLCFLPRNITMNADRYIGFLRNHLVDMFVIHGSEVLMHDSCLG